MCRWAWDLVFGRAGIGDRPGLRRRREFALGARGDRPSWPAGGKQVGRGQLRDHGPIDFGRRAGESRLADRLPLVGDAGGAVSARLGGGGADTSTRRGLVDSAYNEHRANAKRHRSSSRSRPLRDVTLDAIRFVAGELDALPARRALHVLARTTGTEKAAEAMKKGDAVSSAG